MRQCLGSKDMKEIDTQKLLNNNVVVLLISVAVSIHF